jgi:phosphoribosylformimino-5-aminoimidazole carboxamide ribotide isomerase
MLVIPSIDIYRGKCVQWVGGKPGTGKTYGDPLEFALRWQEEGASWLHIIDLDAALGTGDNFPLIVQILRKIDIHAQVGGGIRTPDRARELLKLGADRIILGTAAVEHPEMVEELVKSEGGRRIMVALDSKGGKVLKKGWTQETDANPLELALKFEKMGVGSFLYTEVEVEGKMQGLKLETARKLIPALKKPVFLSGGIATLEDILAAKEVGAAGVVVGMSLYEGKFTLKGAMEVAE